MQKEQTQTHHGGTGEQESEVGTTPPEKKPGKADEPEEGSRLRNPSGDDLSDAREGDEGSGRNV